MSIKIGQKFKHNSYKYTVKISGVLGPDTYKALCGNFDIILTTEDLNKNYSKVIPEMTYLDEDFLEFTLDDEPATLKCECGADTASYPFHSDYCPKHKKD